MDGWGTIRMKIRGMFGFRQMWVGVLCMGLRVGVRVMVECGQLYRKKNINIVPLVLAVYYYGRMDGWMDGVNQGES